MQQLSRDKFNSLPRATTEFTLCVFDRYGLRDHWPLARRSRLRSGSCTLARAFAPRFPTPLRFAITSPLSGSEEDFHLQAVEHARRTKTDEPALRPAPYVLNSATRFESQRLEDKLRGQLDQARTLRARPIVYKWP